MRVLELPAGVLKVGHCFCALLLMGAGILQAGPITYTFNTTGTGTLAGTPFANAPITVTSVADTSEVVVSGSSPDFVYDIYPAITTIDVGGFAPATFTDPTFWEDPNGSGDIIFGIVDTQAGVASCNSCHALLGFTALFTGLESYNLEASFGPVSSPLDFETSFFNTFDNISTSDGSLSLVASNDTFVATAAASPEPESVVLAGLALAGMIAACRARRRNC
jgi:hypothetical protein